MNMLSKKLKPFIRYLYNTLWIMGDKITSLLVGFFVTIIIARHLGPDDYGIYSYALSVAALFAAAGHMGLSGLVVREIVKNNKERGLTLGTALILKFIGMIGGYVILLIYAAVYEGVSSIEFTVIGISGAALLFKPTVVIDFWFQAFVQARFATLSNLIGLALSSLLKILFVLLGFGVVYFAVANLFQAIVVALTFIIIYRIKSGLPFSMWRFSWAKAKLLFSQGWVIYLGSIFAVIYLKVDQIMLRWFVDSEAVGIYAVAAQLSEAWYFVPSAIVASFFPRLIQLRDENSRLFHRRFQQIFDLLFVLALCVAVAMSFLSEKIILLFFGDHYIKSASVLVIHIWAALFIFMRAAFSKWILIENALVFSLITQGTGALVNVGLNYILIPKYGVHGAAYATLISYAFASFFSLIMFSKTRPIFYMMLKSIFGLFRYPRILYEKCVKENNS